MFKGDYEGMSERKGNYYLLLSRNNESFKVHFLEVTQLHLQLIESLKKGQVLEVAINESLSSFDIDKSEENQNLLLKFIGNMYSEGFVLGKLS